MTTRKTAELKPHPDNARIYGDGASAEMVDSIRAKGILVPLLVTWDNRVIGGHRRLAAAKQVGLDDVPVTVFSSRDELDILEALIHSNKQRQKTNEQMGREAITLDVVEKERAKQRQQNSGGDRKSDKAKIGCGNVATTDPNAGKSRDKVAAALGVSGKTVDKLVAVVTKIDELEDAGEDEAAEKLRTTLNKKSADAARKEIDKEKKEKEFKQRRQSAIDTSSPVDKRVQAGLFCDLMKKLPDESIDLIFTDPPYGEESIPLYAELAEHAQRVLRPNGSLIAYAGHYALGEVITGMSEHLRFWWTLAVLHSSGNRRFPGKWVFVGWKPLVWFVKGGRRDKNFISDVLPSSSDFQSDNGDKDLHEWQQSECEAAYLIENLTKEGETVLDPMCGSGTTLAAALRLKRVALGFDKDSENVAITRKRISGL